MWITRVKVRNYRVLRECSVLLNKGQNIIVGDNESGKSTLIECINLALSGQLNGRSAQAELHPLLFNLDTVREYIESLRKGEAIPPPSIVIELFLSDEPGLAQLRGINNSERMNCPGLTFKIEFNEEYKSDYEYYIKEPEKVRVLPIEYYSTRWGLARQPE